MSSGLRPPWGWGTVAFAVANSKTKQEHGGGQATTLLCVTQAGFVPRLACSI